MYLEAKLADAIDGWWKRRRGSQEAEETRRWKRFYFHAVRAERAAFEARRREDEICVEFCPDVILHEMGIHDWCKRVRRTPELTKQETKAHEAFISVLRDRGHRYGA